MSQYKIITSKILIYGLCIYMLVLVVFALINWQITYLFEVLFISLIIKYILKFKNRAENALINIPINASKEIIFTYQLSKSEYRKYLLSIIFNTFIALFTMITTTYIIVFCVYREEFNLTITAVSIFIAIFSILFKANKSYTANRLNEKTTYWIDHDHITLISPSKTISYDFESLYKIIEYNNFYLVYPSQNHSFHIPKSKGALHADLDAQFRSFVYAHPKIIKELKIG